MALVVKCRLKITTRFMDYYNSFNILDRQYLCQATVASAHCSTRSVVRSFCHNFRLEVRLTSIRKKSNGWDQSRCTRSINEQRLRSTGSTGYANESGVNEVSASVSERVCVCVVVAVSICETASGR